MTGFDHSPSTPARDEANHLALSTEHLTHDIGRRVAAGSAIAITAQALRMVLALATSIVLARLLAPEDFGVFAMAATVTSFGALFTDLGLSGATVQRKDIDQSTASALFYINIATGVLIMLAAVAVAPIAAWFFNDNRVLWLVIALAPTILLMAGGAQQSALLQRGMRWTALHAVGIAAQFAGGVAGILLAWKTDFGYWALVAQAWVFAAANLALVWLACRWWPSRVDQWGGARSALNFGLGLMGFNVLNYFHRQLDNVLVGAVSGAEQLGYYTRAYGLFMMPLTAVSRPLASAIYPAMCRLQTEPERWRRLYLAAIAAITLFTAPLSILLTLVAEPLILLLFGQQWAPAVPIFQALALSMLIQPVYNSSGWICFSLGLSDRMMRAGVFATLWYCSAFVVGVQYGALGVAIAYTCAVVLLAPGWMWWIARDTPVTLSDITRVVSPPILGALVAGAVAALAHPIKGDLLIDIVGRGALFVPLYVVLVVIAYILFPSWREYVRPVLEQSAAMLRGAAPGRRGEVP